ncbi:MAG: subclass B1 metallo-beta-lactamase [Cyclobacteriaceae bacterium]
MKFLSIVIISFSLISGKALGQNLGDSLITINKDVSLVQVTDNVYVHRSQLLLPSYGKYECNGMLFVDNGQAAIVDTPADLSQTELLLTWLEEQKIEVISVTVNHFHDDCLAGLEAFHRRKIPSYSTLQTQRLAISDSLIAPLYTFSDSLVLKVGAQEMVSKFPGEAHTIDNTVTYVPSEKVLFGGCMMKSLKSGKGNLEDANVEQWSETIEKVLLFFPDMEYVIPGHGHHGGTALLDYTIEMFKAY